MKGFLNGIKLCAIAFLVLTASVLTACQPVDPPEPEPIGVIAVLMPDEINGFLEESVAFAKLEAQILEAEKNISVKIITSSDVEEQNTQILEQIEQEVEGIVLWSHDAEYSRDEVQSAMLANIPVVLYGQQIPLLTPSALLQLDDRQIGRQAAEYFNEFFKEQLTTPGGVQLLEFQTNQKKTAQDRTEGFLEATNPALHIVQTFPDIDSALTARNQMEDWINQASPAAIESIQAVFTHDDDIADGILEAVQNYSGPARLQILLISGVGGKRESIESFTAVRNDFGIEQVTFNQSPANITQAISVAASIVLKQEPIFTDKTIPSEAIDYTNESKYRESDEYQIRYAIERQQDQE